jgi:hypothetical protein
MVYKEEGNLEEAFIHAAKAALLAVEHLYVKFSKLWTPSKELLLQTSTS